MTTDDISILTGALQTGPAAGWGEHSAVSEHSPLVLTLLTRGTALSFGPGRMAAAQRGAQGGHMFTGHLPRRAVALEAGVSAGAEPLSICVELGLIFTLTTAGTTVSHSMHRIGTG